MQRMPEKNGTPVGTVVSPCRKMQLFPLNMPAPFNASEPGSVASDARFATPVALIVAPWAAEFAQPSPAGFGFLQTQAETPAWPGTQKTVPGPPTDLIWIPLQDPKPDAESYWIVIVPALTVTVCLAYVTPRTCPPGQAPPTICGPSEEPVTVTRVRNPALSGAQEYEYTS